MIVCKQLRAKAARMIDKFISSAKAFCGRPDRPRVETRGNSSEQNPVGIYPTFSLLLKLVFKF